MGGTHSMQMLTVERKILNAKHKDKEDAESLSVFQ